MRITNASRQIRNTWRFYYASRRVFNYVWCCSLLKRALAGVKVSRV
ncbi:DUF3265 domain-containing protein [Vibrio tasmaniensis]|uniref:DUF3265 domain-containing protein n=1 Tax=Vibrio tasmaniensis TaxID=212663 RepID=A0AB38NH77_9VIBR|nr:DUF3265 domain-containing protein [Vibrio tasmaniensis]TKG38882.1 DUF3265 domain-containing protein [Vibrio tasmaniensis]TKG39579.1 DUF3265 domain-containing protein [Vibrio tasmaniensis]TKG40990.1 DUF3265 domain-containing protein [Vibrio tasmaniensis]TKG44831.1 DUF3265 domain-containing protein [Vibrio tasmaniensis]